MTSSQSGTKDCLRFLPRGKQVELALSVQLPIYYPSEEEKADPKLYAANVRELMLREGGFKPSHSTLADSRAYIALMEGRKPPANSVAGQELGIEANGAKPNGKPAKDDAGIPVVPTSSGVKKLA